MYGNTRVHVNNQSPNSALQCELKLVSSRAEKNFFYMAGTRPFLVIYVCLWAIDKLTRLCATCKARYLTKLNRSYMQHVRPDTACHMQGRYLTKLASQILDKVEYNYSHLPPLLNCVPQVIVGNLHQKF